MVYRRILNKIKVLPLVTAPTRLRNIQLTKYAFLLVYKGKKKKKVTGKNMYIFPACFNVIDNFPKVKHNKKVNVKLYFFLFSNFKFKK